MDPVALSNGLPEQDGPKNHFAKIHLGRIIYDWPCLDKYIEIVLLRSQPVKLYES